MHLLDRNIPSSRSQRFKVQTILWHLLFCFYVQFMLLSVQRMQQGLLLLSRHIIVRGKVRLQKAAGQ